MHHRHCITKKASNFTELSAKYKLYLISIGETLENSPLLFTTDSWIKSLEIQRCGLT